MLYASIWEPSEHVVARCRRSLAYLPWGRMPLHDAPASDCICGIYGASHMEQATPLFAVRAAEPVVFRVLGRVAIWGRIVEAELGWRAQFGYPDAVYVPRRCRQAGRRWRRPRLRPEDVARELGDYRVPVDVVGG